MLTAGTKCTLSGIAAAKKNPSNFEGFSDPAFAAVEAHRLTAAEHRNASKFEDEIEAARPSQGERNIVLARARERYRLSARSMDAAAWRLSRVTPASVGGLLAVIKYVDHVNRTSPGDTPWPGKEGEWTARLIRSLASSPAIAETDLLQ